MSEEQVTEEPVEQPADLLSLIKSKTGAPSQDAIDKWKAKYGAVYASGFSEDELFVFRAISRTEYKKIQIETQDIANIKDPKEATSAQMASEEKIVSMCLLWPARTPEELANDKGGVVPSLLEMIFQNSHFLTPQQASMLVVKL